MAEKEATLQTKPTSSSEIPFPVYGDRSAHPNESDDIVTNYLNGWSLHVVTIALCLALFLASLEVSIVATSLIAITDDLQGFSESSWIVTSYMLTYTGFLIIWAKLSDIFGRKLFIIASVCLFVIFSGACGAAQTITQLIIFRALQGIGGAGTYSMAFVIFFELVPPEKFASIFFTGAPFTVAIIQIPQRFQAVNNMSALGAGVRLLPFAIPCAIGSALTAAVAGRAKIPPIYLMLGGSAIQVVGFALLSTAPETTHISSAQYGYEAIAGFAVGITVAMSAVIQFRTMGGAIGLAIVTTVINSYLRNRLAGLLPPDQIAALLQSTDALGTLPPALAETVRGIFARGYNLQLRIMIGFSAAQIPVTFLMWQRKQIVV
ncbi:MAG: hypothetical protein ASARMPREDX12_003478 [Alectoria sarmentosa]|nr:MAG: hypothetical protein ASARMPREDX12_003478 [Alectoria sarmentosa]